MVPPPRVLRALTLGAPVSWGAVVVGVLVLALVLAVIASLPAVHAVTGFDIPDAFDHGIDAQSMRHAALSPVIALAVLATLFASALLARTLRGGAAGTRRACATAPRTFMTSVIVRAQALRTACDGDDDAHNIRLQYFGTTTLRAAPGIRPPPGGSFIGLATGDTTG